MLAAQHKQHGKRRAFLELIKSGVKGDVAKDALNEVYKDSDATAIARQLAEKHAPRLRSLDAAVARRRLVGMLQRRGFDYESIKPVVEEVLGRQGGGEE
jgi:regulatory protein